MHDRHLISNPNLLKEDSGVVFLEKKKPEYDIDDSDYLIDKSTGRIFAINDILIKNDGWLISYNKIGQVNPNELVVNSNKINDFAIDSVIDEYESKQNEGYGTAIGYSIAAIIIILLIIFA